MLLRSVYLTHYTYTHIYVKVVYEQLRSDGEFPSKRKPTSGSVFEVYQHRHDPHVVSSVL